MTDITELVLTGGGSTVVASDVMLADIASFAAISSGLGVVLNQLAIADATLTETARAMLQVGWGRSAMDEAWTAAKAAQGVCDYLGDQLDIAIANYTETENNVEALALGVDHLASYLAGTALSLVLGGGFISASLPGWARDAFDDRSKPIGADDFDPTNPAFNDPKFVEMVRRFVMTGDSFADGYGGNAAEAAEQLKSMGFTGVGLSAQLLMLYAAQAGLLRDDSDVTVTKTGSSQRYFPIDSIEGHLKGIPDPAQRSDGAQIRIDEIHDGDTVRYEVFIAGTADFNPISLTEPWDLASNVAGVGGDPPASYRSAQLAMEQAGITDESAVSFVGYSQGGLVASMLAASGDYNTKGLVTIGGPSGQIIIPPGVPALLIEHYEDMVTALGGTQENTDAMVVRRHAFNDENPPDPTLPMPGHQLQYYLETARLIDNAESPQLTSTVAELNEFSSGDSVTSTWYAAERVP